MPGEVAQERPEYHVYSRLTQPVTTRVEAVLSQITVCTWIEFVYKTMRLSFYQKGHAITYRSGMSAVYAALIHYQPKRIAIRGGYHGVPHAIEMHKRTVPSLVSQFDIIWCGLSHDPMANA